MISASPTGPATWSMRRLAGQADLDQRVQDAVHRAEQSDERRGGTDRGQERQAVRQLAVQAVDRTRAAPCPASRAG